MIVYKAAWVLPIAAPPLTRGWLAVADGRIVAYGGAGSAPPASPTIDLGHVALLPGLVNAHTHLELSSLRGQVAPSASMPAWARALMARRGQADADDPGAIRAAIAAARAAGTALVGDISNTLASVDPLADSPLHAVVFYELLGFRADDAARRLRAAVAALRRRTPGARMKLTLAVHAPYSAGPALLAATARHGARPLAVHLAESAEELEFLRSGTGAWRTLLDELGVWDESWRPPGSGPVAYLEGLGVIDRGLVAAHGVHLTADELARLAAADATVVTCPRSNAWTGAGTPPVDRFYAAGVRVAIGTDSLASAPDLNVFAELAALRRLAPGVDAARLLDSATRQGARALGFGGELGTLEPGRRAEVLAVDVRGGVSDVEEYLVGGVDPVLVRWLRVRS